MPSPPPKGLRPQNSLLQRIWEKGQKQCQEEVCPISFHRTCLNTSFKIIFPHLSQYWHKGKALSLRLNKRRGSDFPVYIPVLCSGLEKWDPARLVGQRRIRTQELNNSKMQQRSSLPMAKQHRFKKDFTIAQNTFFDRGKRFPKSTLKDPDREEGIYPTHTFQRCQEA